MKAMSLEKIVSVERCDRPLRAVELPKPEPAPGEICIAISACGVCHTELDEIEGRTPPHRLNAIIDTTPAWTPVVSALGNLAPGGRLVINAIRKENADKSAMLGLSYHEHLWMEREIKSVANITRRDIAEFLPLAAEIPIRPSIETYRLEEANEALVALKRDSVQGAKVLKIR